MTYLKSNSAAERMRFVVGIQETSSKGSDVNVAREAQVDEVQTRQNISTNSFLLMSLEPILQLELERRKTT